MGVDCSRCNSHTSGWGCFRLLRGTSRVMTRLLERLEQVLEHTPFRAPLRATAPRHRRDSLRRVTAARLIVPADPRPATHAGPSTDPATGFPDCRGEWHDWEDAS